MKTIYRYTINNSDGWNLIEMPTSAQIIKVDIVNELERIPFSECGARHFVEKICIWALIDTDDVLTTRKFLVAGTGANLDDTVNCEMPYIGSVKKKNEYMFHVFEVKNR